MNGIFINYRREDTSAYAGRLYDALVGHFGPNRVFIDIDTIRPGEDFREVIQRTCTSCEVLLAVIGKNWMKSRDKKGKSRLHNENDLVRMEIASALEKRLHVIPVLVGGAEMPEPSTLPQDLQSLAFRNAWEISDKRFRQDAQGLADAIKEIVATSASTKVVYTLPAERRPTGSRSEAESKAPEEIGASIPEEVAVILPTPKAPLVAGPSPEAQPTSGVNEEENKEEIAEPEAGNQEPHQGAILPGGVDTPPAGVSDSEALMWILGVFALVVLGILGLLYFSK